MKKILLGILAVVILIFIAGYLYLRSYLPDYNAKITVPDLKGKVTIKRNTYAVPSITAENQDDLYFAWGYVNAQDRMFQMEITKRIGQGRISEFAGESTLTKDIFLRAVGFYEIAMQGAEQLSPEHRRKLQRYVDGINYFLAHEKKPFYLSLLGIEAEKWTLTDPILVGLMLNWSLAYNMSHELLYHKIASKIGKSKSQELLNFIPTDSPTIALRKRESSLSDARFIALSKKLGPLMGGRSASNNWVIAPSKTVYSGAIMANDLHLDSKIPSDFYIIHVKAKNFEVAGGQVAGLPLVVMGYNQNIAWGVTNQGADIVDVFFESINWDNKTYMRHGKQHPLNSKTVKIKIKGKDPVKKELYYAGRRPLLNEVFTDLDEVVSIDWAGFDGMDISGFFDLNNARNHSQFITAINKINMTPQNMLYADFEGNIAYRTIGTLVKRKPGTGNFPQQGNEVETSWDGLLDPYMNPALLNPNRGFIVTANNKVVQNFPYDMNGTFAPRYRYENIVKMLAGKNDIDVDYTQQMQSDTNSALARKIIPIIRKYVHVGNEQRTREAFNLVTAWDGNIKKDSPAPSIYNTWLVRFMYHTFVDELGKELTAEYVEQRYISLERFLSLLELKSGFFDDVKTPEKESAKDIATRAFKETLQILAEYTGSKEIDGWQWGKIHQIRFDHFLGKSKLLRPMVNYGPFPLGGDCETNLRAHFYKTAPPFTPELTAAIRLIVQFNPKPKGYLALVSGENEYFLSKHYTDLTDLWMNAEYFCVEEAETKYETVLIPK